jgi:CubicO group peptidase (beta-lactamase class C family)
MAAQTSVAIHGTCDPRFEAVRRAFERNFIEHADVGATVAVVVDGETVVDLWAGSADRERTRPWGRDTIVNVYSATKGMTALCAHMLADRGLLDFDEPVATYWPEFAQAGKEQLPVRYLLTHQAGLPFVRGPSPPDANLRWDVMVKALAEQAPLWPPGERHGVHASTFGWLVGEVIRRVSGRSVGAFLRDEVTGPLGVDFLLGFGPEEDHRVAETLEPAQRQSSAEATRNSREYRAAEIPSGNGHGNARALATVYGALARGGEIGGVRLLSPEAVERAAAEQVMGIDAVMNIEVQRSLGFTLPVPGQDDDRGARSFGHAGAGGSLGYADPETKLGFGYAMNQMWVGGTSNRDPRARKLVRAANASL